MLAAVMSSTAPVLHSSPTDGYVPSQPIMQARQEFADHAFGVFIHWGIYSMFGQGEWYLNRGIDHKEYAKAAAGFYPANFNAAEWVSAIKGSGAKYICITTRHHDGFSMWDTKQSDYNIVKATPFKRDCRRMSPPGHKATSLLFPHRLDPRRLSQRTHRPRDRPRPQESRLARLL